MRTVPDLAKMVIEKARGLNAGARALGFYSARSLAQWRDGETIPEPEDEPRLRRLSEFIEVPFEEVLETVRRDRVARAQRQRGNGGPHRNQTPSKPPVKVGHPLLRGRAPALATA